MGSGVYKKHSFYLLTLIIFCLIQYSPLLFSLPFWGGNDFDYNFFQLSVTYDSLLKYFEFPLWNPYDQGGAPLVAVAHSRSLSPFFLLYTIFDYLIALKVEIVLHAIIGSVGMYLFLEKELKNSFSALWGAILFNFSSLFVLQVAQGQFELMTFVYIPLLFYFSEFESIKKIVSYALVLTVMFFEGGVYSIVISQSCLFVKFLIEGTRQEKQLRFKNLFMAYLWFVGFSALKLFPSVDYMLQHPRLIDEYSGFSLWSLLHSLVNSAQKVYFNTNPEAFYEPLEIFRGLSNQKGFIEGIDHGWDENGFFVGWIALFLSFSGLFICMLKRQKKAIAYVGIFFFALWLSFGDRAPVSLWALLHEFPIFQSMRHATRFRVILLLIICLFYAVSIKSLLKISTTKKRAFFVYFIIISSLYPVITLHRDITSTSFQIPPYNNLKRATSFYHIDRWQEYPLYERSDTEGFFPAYLENKGVLYDKENQSVPIGTLSRSSDDYRGEIYSKEDDVDVKLIRRTMNTLSLESSDKSIIEINMNYMKGWRCFPDCEVKNHLNRINVHVKDKGTYKIYYLPLSFISGIVVSISSIFVLLFLILRSRKRPRLQRA